MYKQQQKECLERFMMKKFSVDKEDPPRVMVPLPIQRWKRAAISWGDRFYMFEEEMKCIAEEVMIAYWREVPVLLRILREHNGVRRVSRTTQAYFERVMAVTGDSIGQKKKNIHPM